MAASNTATSSGTIGIYKPTVSPATTPSAFRAFATRPTIPPSSAKVRVRRSPPSETQCSAGRALRSDSAWRSRQLRTMLSFPPWNHLAQGKPSLSSRTVWYGWSHSTPRSFSASSQNHTTSSVERAISSSYSEMLCLSMNRRTLHSLRYGPYGSQITQFSGCVRSATGTPSPPMSAYHDLRLLLNRNEVYVRGLKLGVPPVLSLNRHAHADIFPVDPHDSGEEQGICPVKPVSYTHLRAHETKANLVCRLLLEKKKKTR